MSVKCCKQIFKILLLNIIIFQTTSATGPRLSKTAQNLSLVRNSNMLPTIKGSTPYLPTEIFTYNGISLEITEIPQECKSNSSCCIKKLTCINKENINHKISLTVLTIKNSTVTTIRIVANIYTPIKKQIYQTKFIQNIELLNNQYYRKQRKRLIQICLERAIDKYLQEINPLDEWDTPQELERPQFPY